MNSHQSQHEEWHSLYRKALLNGDDSVSFQLITRAGRIGTLQCAALSTKDNSHSIQALLRHTQEEMDVDAGTSSRSLFRQLERNITSVPSKEKPTSATQLDVDAFFEEYPECQKQNWDDKDYQESSDDESEEEDENLIKSRPNKDAKIMQSDPFIPQQTINAQGNRLANPYHKAQTKHPVGPQRAVDLTRESNDAFRYTPASQQQSQERAPPLGHQFHPTNSGRNTLPDKRQAHRNTNYVAPSTNTGQYSSWENHQNHQNPFQTAREMAQIEEPSNNDQKSSWNEQKVNNNRNPYVAHQPPSAEDTIIRGGPSIPESLKRKFQPPKRVGESSKTTNGGKRNTQSYTSSTRNNSSSNGGAQIKPPSVKASSNNTNADDEELPEELQDLDKELVKKIQNEIMESGDMITFDDIAGLDDAKQTVQEVVCWPMKRPDLFTGLRRAPNGLLLYGPPGTGKTLIGKAIAYESGATFFSISSSSLTSKWIGEGEKLVRTLFAVAAYREPAVVFIDEIDSLLTQRKATENEASRRIKTEFLVQLDGTGTTGQGRVLVIGATNRPQELDEAARRRFVKRLYIPLPVEKDRAVLLDVMLKKNNHRLTPSDVEKLAKDTEGFSGADLKALCTDAAMGPIRQLGTRALSIDVKDVPPISFKHFKRSLKGTKPSVAPGDLVQYEEWDKIYGSKRANEEDEDDSDDD